MKYSVIANHDPKSIREAIEEERLQFIVFVLDAMGVPIEDCFPDSLSPQEVTIDHREKLRAILEKYNINIVDNYDKTCEIFLEKDKVASWMKPWVELKKDFSEVNPKRRIYVEIHLNCWSVFEEMREENNDE